MARVKDLDKVDGTRLIGESFGDLRLLLGRLRRRLFRLGVLLDLLRSPGEIYNPAATAVSSSSSNRPGRLGIRRGLYWLPRAVRRRGGEPRPR